MSANLCPHSGQPMPNQNLASPWPYSIPQTQWGANEIYAARLNQLWLTPATQALPAANGQQAPSSTATPTSENT